MSTRKRIKYDFGERAIHVAARDNNLSEIERLLSRRAAVDPRNDLDQTPLHVAACCNRGDSHYRTIEILLTRGADVNTQDDDGQTPLSGLMYFANVRIVQLLLDFKADVNIVAKNGRSPLFTAVFMNNVEVMKLLIDHGSDINNCEDSILHWAIYCGNLDAVKCLLNYGAYIKGINILAITVLGCLSNTNADFRSRNYIATLIFLLKYADINVIDRTNERNDFLKFCRNEDIWKITIQHVAKLKALSIFVNQDILNIISNRDKYKNYLILCEEELSKAKSTKLKNCWVSYFNLLVDNKRKLKNYAGNQDVIDELNNSECLNNFPIYGDQIKKNIEKGIERRKFFDESTVVLSNQLRIFNSTHLVVRDMLDLLTLKDFVAFVTQV